MLGRSNHRRCSAPRRGEGRATRRGLHFAVLSPLSALQQEKSDEGSGANGGVARERSPRGRGRRGCV